MTVRKIYLCLLILFGSINCTASGPAKQPDVQEVNDVNDVPCKSLFASGDKNKHYFLIGAYEKEEVPADGFALLVVIPGGGWGIDYSPFSKQIYKYSLNKRYIVAQLVAVKWTPVQVIVWPTNTVKVDKQKFSTEEFVEAVVKDVKAKYKLDQKYIFTLSWSSSGPAAYEISMQKEKSVTGSYIAMSIFRPERYEPLDRAAGHCYFIDHSPQDEIVPYAMAENANKLLSEHGAQTSMISYNGGHGWYGDVFGRINLGIRQLEGCITAKNQGKSPTPPQSRQRQHYTLPVVDGFETGEAAPAEWRQGAKVEGVEYIWDKKVAYKGNASLCLKKTDKQFFPVAQWHRQFIHDGTTRQLKVSAYVKAEQATKAIIDVQFLGPDRKWIGHEGAAYIGAKVAGEPPAEHDWKEYSGTVTIPEKTRGIAIALQIYGPGTVWFDELTAEYLDTKPAK